MYHRVAEVHPDIWSLCVTPRHFAEHLEILRKFGRPLQIQQITQSHLKESPLRRWFSITFDDGYADILHNTKPLLEHYNIPATVFLTLENIVSKREFWWDELERILLQSSNLPEELYMNINGNTYHWTLGEAKHYREDISKNYYTWQVSDKEDPCLRHSLYRSLHALLLPMPHNEQQKVLNELRAWSGSESMSRPTHRPLTLEEVVELVKGDLLEVGSHSLTHSNLATISTAMQRDEIKQSKTFLEDILNRAVNSFSYPYGSYTDETVTVVREAGFVCACTVNPGVVELDTDQFQLPRIMVEDWDGEEFARRLSIWFKG
ncbi:MAG: hypothetical protein A2Y97_06495 [Nitrospirae bacterium RBG_13_39_12]|nr:MAG: hypothetical protein A2Y97_06495 [Nitrospirae bacterium RBG_13_39_12]